MAALQRQGLASQEAIAAIAADGIGQMSGYGSLLGDAGVQEVSAWVWQQALQGWTADQKA
jgi:cytochrome c6